MALQAIRAGNSDAFSHFVDRYGDRLFSMFLYMTNGNHELAGEFAQETFIRAFERLSSFNETSTFYTWLYRIGRNRALDMLNKKAPQALDREHLERIDDNHTSQPYAAMERNEEQHIAQQHIHHALATLSDEHREIILLRDFDSSSYTNIADTLSISEGTVKSRLSRARNALRAAVQLIQGGRS